MKAENRWVDRIVVQECVGLNCVSNDATWSSRIWLLPSTRSATFPEGRLLLKFLVLVWTFCFRRRHVTVNQTKIIWNIRFVQTLSNVFDKTRFQSNNSHRRRRKHHKLKLERVGNWMLTKWLTKASAKRQEFVLIVNLHNLENEVTAPPSNCIFCGFRWHWHWCCCQHTVDKSPSLDAAMRLLCHSQKVDVKNFEKHSLALLTFHKISFHWQKIDLISILSWWTTWQTETLRFWHESTHWFNF